MNSREKCLRILDRQNTGSPGYWVGHPNEKTIPLLAEAWGIEPTREAIQTYLDDDLRWVPADAAYHHPEGRPAFDPTYGIERHSLATEGCLAEGNACRCGGVSLAGSGILRLYRNICAVGQISE